MARGGSPVTRGTGLKPAPTNTGNNKIAQIKKPRRINKDILLVNHRIIFFILLGLY